MTDTPAPTEEQIAAARALVAQADAAAAAERQAKADAATAAVRQLVASDEFKAVLPLIEAANAASPKDIDLGYAVTMLERLRDRYAA